MSSVAESTKSVPMPHFDGSDDKFELFWPKFEAYASLKGFSKAIDPNGPESDLPTKEDDYTTGNEDKKKLEVAATQRNRLAIASFTIAFDTVALMNRISDAKTVSYPNGLAYKVAQGLMSKYRPNDRVSKLEALAELETVTMSKDEEPDDLFNKIAAVQQQYKGSGMDQANYLNHVIKIAPEEYKEMIAIEVRTKKDSLKLSDLQEAMNTLYRLNNNKAKMGHSNVDNTESTLVSLLIKAMRNNDEAAMATIAKELCYKCGKPGHKAYQCKSSSSYNKYNNGGRGRGRDGGRGNRNGRGFDRPRKFNGTCNNCGKTGHKEADCWDLDKNKSKRPKAWKNRTENGNRDNNEGGNVSAEYVMAAIDDSMSNEYCNEVINIEHEDRFELSLMGGNLCREVEVITNDERPNEMNTQTVEEAEQNDNEDTNINDNMPEAEVVEEILQEIPNDLET